MSEMIEGFSDDFIYLIATCAFTAGAGYVWDRYMPRIIEARTKRKLNGTVCKFLPSNSSVPLTFSETAAAIRDGQLPTCPICLELVRHAVETSWSSQSPLLLSELIICLVFGSSNILFGFCFSGHAFCGECFYELWAKTKVKVSCPMDRRKIYTVYASQALRNMAYEILVGMSFSDGKTLAMDCCSAFRAKLQAEQDAVDLGLQAYNQRDWGRRGGAVAAAVSYREDLRWAARALRELHRLPLRLGLQLALLLGLALLYLIMPIDIFSEARPPARFRTRAAAARRLRRGRRLLRAGPPSRRSPHRCDGRASLGSSSSCRRCPVPRPSPWIAFAAPRPLRPTALVTGAARPPVTRRPGQGGVWRAVWGTGPRGPARETPV